MVWTVFRLFFFRIGEEILHANWSAHLSCFKLNSGVGGVVGTHAGGVDER